MKLHYKIIWIDDDIEDYIEMGFVEEFKAFLRSLEFNPTVDCFETGTSAEEKLKSVKYDLILSDYNIKEGEQGDTLIRKIRSGEVFTEVLFYSAKADFEKVAKELYQDRVSYHSLVGDEGFKEFKQKVFRLVDLTVAKVQELNNIRGLVMAESSELDNSIEDILVEVASREGDLGKKLRDYIVKKVKTNLEERTKTVAAIDQMTSKDIVKNRMLFDASKKSRSLNEYLRLSGLDKEESFKDFHQNYDKDVLLVRNDLAHAKSEEIDGIEYLIVLRQGEEQPVKYNQEACIKIRGTLNRYSGIVKKIREKITVDPAAAKS